MKPYLYFLMAAVVLMGACESGGQKSYPYRWVRVYRALDDDRHVEEIAEIARTASEHGLNGLVLSAGLDMIDLKGPDYIRRLKEVQNVCEQYGLEIIPSMMNVGFGNSVLAHDKNLAAGLPVRDALFVVAGGEARLVADPPIDIVNGGFEDHRGNRVADYSYHGTPGEIIFTDSQVFKEGRSSLRFENFGKYPDSTGRLSQQVAVQPYRCYRLSCWVKTSDLDVDGQSFGVGRFSGLFRLYVYGVGDSRLLVRFDPRVASTGDWTRVSVGFNSLNYDKVEISAAAFGGTSGKFWVDGLHLEEVGLTNILRRPGTPLTVRSEKKGTVYVEGDDYQSVADPELDFYFDHEGPVIRILPEGLIADGERLRVSYYHGMSVPVNKQQVTVCMSEPKLYEIWRTQVRLIHQQLAPDKYFLPMDEIRAGGSCAACKERNMTMGQILGDCITRQAEIVREFNPEAEVFLWSDMLNPHHNAGKMEGEYYYMVDGDFYGSWNYVPKDLVMVCWWHEIRNLSLKHFSSLGFRTLGSSSGDLEVARDWLVSLDATPGVCGIMYTTWQDEYETLGPFGDLVSRQ